MLVKFINSFCDVFESQVHKTVTQHTDNKDTLLVTPPPEYYGIQF